MYEIIDKERVRVFQNKRMVTLCGVAAPVGAADRTAAPLCLSLWSRARDAALHQLWLISRFVNYINTGRK